MKQLSILFMAATLMFCLNANAQLYVGGGLNFLNSPDGDFDKNTLRTSFGYSSSIGYAFKGKYYIGLGTQNYAFIVDEDKYMSNHPVYHKTNGSFDYRSSGVFLDLGYKYSFNRKNHLLGTIGFGQFAVTRMGYSMTNGFYRISSDEANMTGYAGRFRASYLYNLNRNVGIWAGISYMKGRADGEVVFNGDLSVIENTGAVFSFHAGLFLSLLNNGY